MATDEAFPSDVPKSNILPGNTYELELETITDGASSTGKRMFSAVARVRKPEEFDGRPRFYNFVTGSDQQPLAINKHARGTIEMQQLVIACGVNPAGMAIGAMLQAATGKKFGEEIKEAVRRDTGEPENKTVRFFQLGEYPIGAGPLAAGPKSAAGAPKAPPTRDCVSCGASGIPAAEFVAHTETCGASA